MYAASTDGGPAGLHEVTVDVSGLTTGGTAVQLTAGSWVVGGTTYTYRSAVLTSDSTVTDGDATVTVTARIARQHRHRADHRRRRRLASCRGGGDDPAGHRRGWRHDQSRRPVLGLRGRL